MYILFPAPVPLADFGGWSGNVEPFDRVIGHSHLGHAFLADEAGHHAVLHPFRAAYKQYGPFASVADFEKNVLADPGFAEYVLRPAHLAAVARRAGPLREGQIYIPAPYPHLGGDESPESYARGMFREFMILVAASHGYDDA